MGEGEKRKAVRKDSKSSALGENLQYIFVFGVILAILAVVLVSVLALKLPALGVCLAVLLEAGIAVCLHDVPIWFHGLVLLAEIIAGILCAVLLFMVLCAALYIAEIIVLKFLRDNMLI